ncbi:hypothetical protein [Flavobacterium sp. KACC 22761]|uniref:hypothetical protein n=1 Tax=Flavobacterium sp. KACC 22761 TaxID=3092665 RepID=UPI002A750439|nr:hypothetical protein [Flavobacterium sp. KACC 22761]WPO79922.1 hypothetical protein SCB73_05970 [Flavobacterium sp. KACC 22761]
MVRAFILILIILTANSCIAYYKNEEGVFLPKHPRYSLKDKKNFVFPQMLDTTKMYAYYGYYENDALIKDSNFENWHIYKKFCKNGHAFSFGTKELKKGDLKRIPTDYYYYNFNTNLMSYETFVIAEGGQYIIIKYKLSKEGDTLTSINNGKRSHVYIKTNIIEQTN